MRGDGTVKLNLKGAPIIVTLAAIESHSELTMDWPSKLELSDLKLPKKRELDIKEKLDWIRRQYDVLMKNPKTAAFAPHVVPYSALATLHISTDGRRFAMSLAEHDYPLEYAKNLSQTLSKTLGIKHVNQLSNKVKQTPGALVADRTRFRVVSHAPLNELEIGFAGFYEKSGLAYTAAFEAWLDLSYEDKNKLLERSIKAGRARPYYGMEVILEPQLLLDGIRAKMFSVDAIQAPTPSHGYSLPKNLADGGMLERCFDISYQLYSELANETSNVASLVCLWGHRQRALINIDIENLQSIVATKTGRLQKLSKVLIEKLTEKHPSILEVVGATDITEE